MSFFSSSFGYGSPSVWVAAPPCRMGYFDLDTAHERYFLPFLELLGELTFEDGFFFFFFFGEPRFPFSFLRIMARFILGCIFGNSAFFSFFDSEWHHQTCLFADLFHLQKPTINVRLRLGCRLPMPGRFRFLCNPFTGTRHTQPGLSSRIFCGHVFSGSGTGFAGARDMWQGTDGLEREGFLSVV